MIRSFMLLIICCIVGGCSTPRLPQYWKAQLPGNYYLLNYRNDSLLVSTEPIAGKIRNLIYLVDHESGEILDMLPKEYPLDNMQTQMSMSLDSALFKAHINRTMFTTVEDDYRVATPEDCRCQLTIKAYDSPVRGVPVEYVLVVRSPAGAGQYPLSGGRYVGVADYLFRSPDILYILYSNGLLVRYTIPELRPRSGP